MLQATGHPSEIPGILAAISAGYRGTVLVVKGRTIRKVMGGGGGGGFSAFTIFFFAHCLCRIFFSR